MILAELIRMSRELLKYLSENGARIEDWQYVTMYERFVRLRKEKVKHEVAVQQMAKDYHVSRATVERILQRFRRELE